MAYLVYTSPTSGTASLDRIVHRVGKGHPFVRVSRPVSFEPREGALHLDADSDTIYWFQGGKFWNHDTDLSRFQTIVHFRDPRDLACNQYYWALQHPNTHDTPDIAERKRRDVEAAGIDAFVMNRNLEDLYRVYRSIEERAPADRVTYTSYTQLCVAFDYLVDSLCKVFDTAPNWTLPRLQVERPENLPGNANWAKIGTVWQGSDVSPGRFRRELQPETIKPATKKFARELDFCRRHDAPFLALHYS